MNNRILFLSGNFYPELTGIGKFNGEMLKWLANHGYECTVISTSPYYPHWKVQKPYSNKWYQNEIIKEGQNDIKVYRCPQYVPSDPSGKKRLIQEVSFSISSFFRLLTILPKRKFDFVITVVPPFYLGIHAVLYKMFRGAKLLYHVQDLQIEAARDLGLIRSKSMINTFFSIEKFILKKADVVSTISKGMIRKMEEKTKSEVIFFPNWVDAKSFYPITDKEGLKKQFGFLLSDKVFLYSGAIGEKQGLEMILSSAADLIDQKDIKFLICGSGPYKEKLMAMAADRGLENVHFVPLQPYEKFNAFLNMADVHLVIQKKGASDLVMPSKLTTILAVGGLALVTAEAGTSLHEVVAENNMGVLIEPENEMAFTDAILSICSSDQSKLKENARAYAEEHLSIDQVLSKYIKHLN